MRINLDSNKFEQLFQDKFSKDLRERINARHLMADEISEQERDYCIRLAVETLLSGDLVIAGEHRKEQWEKGWSENLEEFKEKNTIEAIRPKYFGKHQYSRLNQKFVKGIGENYDANMLGVILDWLFQKYLGEADAIYEFGCGTGHNLLRAREHNRSAVLYGLDWATSSQEIIKTMKFDNMFGKNFDYFNPDFTFDVSKNGIVYTVASLEQIGEKYDKFLSYLLEKKPKLCIHVEPIAELLNEDNLLDYLSIMYFRKRNYLKGFYTELKQMEMKGAVEIVNAQRTYIGSMYIDGYSVIVWKPL